MIAAWMLWSIGAGLLFLVAGLAVERPLDGGRRWVWFGAGVATVALTAVRLLAGRGGGAEVAGGAVTGAEGALTGAAQSGLAGAEEAATAIAPGLSALAVPGDSVLHALDGILVLGWATLSVGLAVWALIGTADLLHRRRFWEPGTLRGRAVLWAREAGPAVVGLVRPRVVLPAWVNRCEPSEQRLILAHEDEHLRGGDAGLRFLMAALLFAFPWNPALWLHYRRLCLAIELDCDRRVVERLPHRRGLYGDLLLRVGGRIGAGSGPVLAAFAERRSFLERRIRRLLDRDPAVGMAQVAFLAFAAILVVAVAVWTPGLTRETDDAELVEEPRIGQPPPMIVKTQPILETPDPISERPQFVVYTVKPLMLNSEELQAAITKEYPALLRDAGIGGTTVVHLFVDETGTVGNVLVNESSGHEALDRAALKVGEVARFSPALDVDEAVAVWVKMDIKFTVN